jgi:hypothetical protein
MEMDWTSAKERVKAVESDPLDWNPQGRKSSERPRTYKNAIYKEGLKDGRT